MDAHQNGIPEGTGPVKSVSGLFFQRFPGRCGRLLGGVE